MPGGWTQKGDASTFLLHKEMEHLLSHQHSAKPLNNVYTDELSFKANTSGHQHSDHCERRREVQPA